MRHDPRATVTFFLLLATSSVACGAPSVTGGAAASAGATPAPKPAAYWSDDDGSIPVSSQDPMLGQRDALVTIVEIADFGTRASGGVQPTLKKLLATYGPDKVRLIWKNSSHDNVAEAAVGVFEVGGNDAFWKFHEAAFANQDSAGERAREAWAEEAGVVNIDAWKAGIAAHEWAKALDADLAVEKGAGIVVSPSFEVNGVRLEGPQPFEKFKEVVDAELAKANAKVVGGTAKDRLYVTISQENRLAAPKAPEETAKKEAPSAPVVAKIPLGSSPSLGNPDALVTMVLFEDFQCPFCGRLEVTLKSLRAKYGDKLRFVWKNNPLDMHHRAEPAAELALEARAVKGDAGFWAAHDKLFEHQKYLSDEVLRGIAKDVGLDADRTALAIKSHRHEREIELDLDTVDDFGIAGTPGTYINGRFVGGAQGEDVFAKVIDEEIAKGEKLVAGGTPPSQVYATVTKDGETPRLTKKTLEHLPASDPAKGNARGKVVIHEFADFECPFSTKVQATLAEILKNRGDEVKVVFHDFPLAFHAEAPLAAEAAREAYAQRGAAGFWKMHDTLFANHEFLKREDLDGYARGQGLDMARWKSALDKHTHKAEVDADVAVGKAAGVDGTPAFVINGYFVSGAQSYLKLRSVIDRANAEAK
jgi:protein-disulfide isomerase